MPYPTNKSLNDQSYGAIGRKSQEDYNNYHMM